jgi:hypothetical protein
MMEAARTSETSVDNYSTRQYITEDNSELHTRRRENLISHICLHSFKVTTVHVNKCIYNTSHLTSVLYEMYLMFPLYLNGEPG